MRIVMLGTGPFAVPTFEALCESEHTVPLLITRPSKPARGRKPPANPTREAAERLQVDVADPDDVNSEECHNLLATVEPDLLVVCDYGQILSAETLAIAPRGGINLHGSLLPRYRGAAPVQWAILNGETETGVTVIHMTPRLDAGPCLVKASTSIDPNETAAELEPRLAELGVEPVRQALQMLEDWDGQSVLGEIQDPALATRAPRLRKQDGEIDWSRSAQQIHNQVRGLQPWPGAFTFVPRSRGEPLRVRVERTAVDAESGPPSDGQPPGTVVGSEGGLRVACGEGVLRILQLQPAGKRVMAPEDYLRGHPLPPGTCLGRNV